ncbi:MAG: hypothetical protein JW993_14605, partial [Sedimentisphaerales bacterium]|nr:hypothetical protein [Sedimentisphaerales bacterium]
NYAGLMARDPASDGGVENWVSCEYFPTWTGFVARNTTAGNRRELGQTAGRWTGADTYAIAEAYPYLQLERIGSDFYPRISADGINFFPLTAPAYKGIYDPNDPTQAPLVISRPDLPETLQVGLDQGMSSADTGYVAFDDFSIVTPDEPLAKVIYVTSVKDLDQDGIQDDVSWADWLLAEGYDVDFRPGNWVDPLDANDIAELEAADLILAGRGMATDQYDGAETAKWSALSTPILCTNAWMIRNNRWKWMNSGSANKDAGSPTMVVLDPNHPIFADVPVDANGLVEVLDPNVASGHTSFLTNFLDPGNGWLLASSLGLYDTAWIVEWEAGVEYYDGAGEIAGGQRLLLMAGTQDDPYLAENGNTAPVGVFNLNEAGQTLLRNALAYLLPKEIAVAGELLVDVSAADPSAGTAVWVNNGTLGDFTYVSDVNDMPVGSKPMTPDPNGPAVEEFEGVPVVHITSDKTHLQGYMGPDAPATIIGSDDRSIEMWVADLNAELQKDKCMIAWGIRGTNGQNMSANFGYKSFGALGLYGDDYDTGFAEPLPTVGTLHHLVYVIENDTATIYVDGVFNNIHAFAGTLATPEAPINLFMQNQFDSSKTNVVLSDNGLANNHMVNSIRIHSGALTDDQVLNNYLVGPAASGN